MSDSAQQVKAQKKAYDEACKRVLSEREIMAHILKACTEEFKDCSLQDIARRYIENAVRRPQMAVRYGPADHKKCTAFDLVRRGRPLTSQTAFGGQLPYKGSLVRPAAMFNHNRSWIMAGFYEPLVTNNEPLYYVHINLEAQNDFNPGYPLLKRAVYYCGRMISSQYGTVFVKSHYEKIQKIYSIWICTMPTKKWEYNISRYRLTEEHLMGHAQAERSHYDLINIVLVCLGSKSYKQLKGILRLLNMLLLDNISSQEKQELLAKEFNVTMTPHL